MSSSILKVYKFATASRPTSQTYLISGVYDTLTWDESQFHVPRALASPKSMNDIPWMFPGYFINFQRDTQATLCMYYTCDYTKFYLNVVFLDKKIKLSLMFLSKILFT